MKHPAFPCFFSLLRDSRLGMVLFVLFFSLTTTGQTPSKTKSYISHLQWDSLLQKHVDQHGNVNYQGFLKEQQNLNDYLSYLSQHSPTKAWSTKEQLAYYINLYNAATVALIISEYPIKSIKDIKNPWGKKWILLHDKKVSLNDIEHKILRKLNEPRIHFAINCASTSCPPLQNQAFTTNILEQQLQEATVNFINSPKYNKITKDKLSLSLIFKWYKKDFTANGSLTDYISQYHKEDIDENPTITYLDYDWSLNENK